jgi:hypothetical protein
MLGVQGLGDLGYKGDRALGLEPALAPEEIAQVRSLDVGHREEEDAILFT